MAVISCTERPEGRAGDENISGAQSVRTYRRVFLVKTDDKNDGVLVVKAATGSATIPQVGEAHPEDISAWCRAVDVQMEAAPMAWHVTANYSSELQFSTNPLNDPAIITWNAEQFQRLVWKDRDDLPITNSAGRFFDDMPDIDDSRWVVRIQKNLAVVPVWLATYQDALNESPFEVDGITIDTELAKLSNISISEVQERNLIQFRVFSYELHLREEGWNLEIFDRGRVRKGESYPSGSIGDPTEDGDRMYKTVNDGDMTESDEVVFLDGQGKQLAQAQVDLGNVVLLSFPVYPLKDFSVLPLT